MFEQIAASLEIENGGKLEYAAAEIIETVKGHVLAVRCGSNAGFSTGRRAEDK